MIDRETGKSRGFGFVSYEDPEISQRLLQMKVDGNNNNEKRDAGSGFMEMRGKIIELKPAQPKGGVSLPGSGGGYRHRNNNINRNNRSVNSGYPLMFAPPPGNFEYGAGPFPSHHSYGAYPPAPLMAGGVPMPPPHPPDGTNTTGPPPMHPYSGALFYPFMPHQFPYYHPLMAASGYVPSGGAPTPAMDTSCTRTGEDSNNN